MTPETTKNGETKLIRTFLAVSLDTTTLNTIESLQKQLSADNPKFYWTHRDNLHLTLHFFGDITEENLEKAAKIVVSVGSLFTSFSLPLTEIGAFPSTETPRVIWVGVEGGRLSELHRTLQKHFQAAGFPVEHRPFRPHVTIGRSRRQKGRILSQPRHKIAGIMRVDNLTLYESRLQPAGVEHHPRRTVRLAEP